MQTPRSSIAEIVWPGVPSHAEAVLMALQYQLEQSQWWSADTLLKLQLRQIEILLRHAYATVPHYQKQLRAAAINPDDTLTSERWAQIPLLTPDILQARGHDLLSTNLPREHGKTVQKKTSGSTGPPIKVTDTDVNRLYWMAITLRDHLWHRRDFAGRLVAIRSGRWAKDPLQVREATNWGPSTSKVYNTGPSTIFYQRMPLEQQAALLQSRDPEYLLVYPSNARQLAAYFRDRKLALPNLREVQTYGEPLLPETRAACATTWGVPVSDIYSCEEAGYIALQCPDSDHYHCQSESLLVEVLDDNNRPCAAGAIGTVVLTSLHNFAMPLIRYENMDYAEVGDATCSCGRGLPVLKRVLGRRRNMAVTPDGIRFWPELPAEAWLGLPGVEELQLVQVAPDRIDVRVVSRRSLDSETENALAVALRKQLGHPYAFTFSSQQDILRHANGKYERFICQVD